MTDKIFLVKPKTSYDEEFFRRGDRLFKMCRQLSAEMEEKVKNNVIIKLGEWHAELIRKHYPEPSSIQCEEKSIELVFKELREMVNRG